MKTIAITAALAGLGLLAVPAVASATTGRTAAGSSTCGPVTGWYVNADETALAPKQTPGGFLFDGASLIHHKTSATLKGVYGNGSFTTAGTVVGARPLFKMETSNPYSTLNRTPAGWWSSKLAATEVGGQNHPVATPSALIGKGAYTESTTVTSFGVGYGNDTGNKALVTSIRFGLTTYTLTYKPCTTPKPVPSAPYTHKPTTTPGGGKAAPTTSTPGEAPAPTPVNSDLPVTG